MYPSLSGMHCRAVTYLIALATMFSHTVGELSMTPLSIESKIGDTTNFNCSTDLESWEIFWYQGNNYIYTGHGILEPFQGRFEIHENASIGSHNLVIHSVESGDAGEYICADDDGFGTRRSAELVVLDNDPDCQTNMQSDGVIGQNIFNIPLDDVHLTCAVTYHGNIPPQMEWKKVGDNRSIRDNVTSNITSNNHLIYTLKLKGDIALDRSSYVCETTRSAMNQYKCTSETIKVLHFAARNTREQKAVRGDKITCTVSNYTFPCIKQWHHDSNYTSPRLYDETITTHLLGEYLCTVKCLVRGTDYTFEALKVFVVEATTSPPPSTSGTVAVAVVVSVTVIILVVVAAVLVVHFKGKHARLMRNMKLEEERLKRFIQEDKQNIQDITQRLDTDEKQDIIHGLDEIQDFIRGLDNDEEHEAVMLHSMGGEHNRVQRQRPRDKVAEEEIELVFKLRDEEREFTIRGVAILSGKFFIVRHKTSQLEVYDCDNFNHRCKLLNVPQLVDAVDICSCKKNNCLYIMDKKYRREPKEVMKINTEEESISNYWPTKENAGGYLSATAEGNVIITVQYKHMLLEYSSEGEWLRDIKLPERINPWHAIKLDNGHYFVSHGTLFERFHGVCLVDGEGNVVKSIDGAAHNQLNVPYYLAAASGGCVMVADIGNNRVLLLDSNLEFKADIVPKYKQRFECPRRVYLDETLGLLVVVITNGNPGERNSITKGNPEKRNSVEVEDSQLIEKDCRLLVFKIQPLLQKYTQDTAPAHGALVTVEVLQADVIPPTS